MRKVARRIKTLKKNFLLRGFLKNPSF